MKDHTAEAFDVLNAIREKPVVIKEMTEGVSRDGTIAFGMKIEIEGREIGIWIPEHSRDPKYVTKAAA